MPHLLLIGVTIRAEYFNETNEFSSVPALFAILLNYFELVIVNSIGCNWCSIYFSWKKNKLDHVFLS